MPELDCDNYLVKVGDKYTFFGVLNDFYDEIFCNCKADTRSGYNGIYNLHILPQLADCVLEQCEQADFDDAMKKIESKKTFAKGTLEQYRHLIDTVVDKAVERGICEPVLFGSIFAIKPGENPATAKAKEFVRNRKSLKIEEERRLYERIMVDPEQDGERMGLALMYAVGMRNNEACGMKFSAIRPMESHPECYCAWIYETTREDTNELKSGGKSKNAPRIVPVPPKLVELIFKRKEFLQGLLDAGKIQLKPEKGQRTVDDLPIACKKTDYTEHCSSRGLTTAGRLLLKDIQINEDEIAYIDRELYNEDRMIEMGVREKDPTAYLLRRNLGTHLNILGLTEAEIQYFMGHDIEDDYETRNYFNNEEKLYPIARKLANRPLFNADYPHDKVMVISDDSPTLQRVNTPVARMRFESEREALVAMQITAVEPQDEIKVHIQSEGHKMSQGKVTVIPAILQGTPRTVNILAQYQQIYKQRTVKEE